MNLNLIRSAVGRVLMGLGGIALIGLLLVTAMPLAHLTPRPVLSGSMEPSIRTGSLLVTKPVDVDTLRVGDVVTVHIGDDYLTHRIADTRVPGDPQAVVTRGDANDADDAPVQRGWVVGKPVTSVPYAGQVLVWSQSGAGFLAVVMTPMLLMIAGAALRPRAGGPKAGRPAGQKRPVAA